jgi:ABC-type Fe3+/spermidine/putrescine transport system ATPase subunit
MNKGRFVQIGAPAEIYERPNSRFVADFVGAVNLLEGEIVAGFNSVAFALPGSTEPVPLTRAPELPAGTAAALALRPEKLRLSRERPPGFALPAIVASIGYQGGRSTLHLARETGPPLRAMRPSEEAASFVRGDPVWLTWSAADAVLLTS